MRWLDKLERHFGFMAIPNLMLAIVLGQAVALLISLQNPTVPMQLVLDPAAVQAGQWWRLLTWVMVPSLSPLSVLLAIFWFLFQLSAARTLEQEWGAFKCTAYLLLGILLPALGAMLLWLGFGVPTLLSGWYFSVTLMLAFAALVPDYSILVFFVLPIKMRWWAWFLGVLLLYRALTGGWSGFFEVLFGAGNYLLFFAPGGYQGWRQRQSSQAAMQGFREARREAEKLPQRTCVACGRGVEADLRLCHCERCGEEGRNYCLEHLQEHLAPVPEKWAVPRNQKRSGRAEPFRKKFSLLSA
jgi:hypothetical protein